MIWSKCFVFPYLCASSIYKQVIYQHVKILPEVLSHEAEQGKERPSKAVKAGVTIVGVPSSFHTAEAFWTISEMMI